MLRGLSPFSLPQALEGRCWILQRARGGLTRWSAVGLRWPLTPLPLCTSFTSKGKLLSAHDPSSTHSLELAEGRVPQDCPSAQPRFSRPSRASAWLRASGGSTGRVAGVPWTRSSGSMIPQRDAQNPGGAFLTVTVDQEAYSAATDGREARGRGRGASCPLQVLPTQKLPEPLK